MKSLDLQFLQTQGIPIEMGGLLQALGEYRGRQDMFQRQTPQVLEALRQSAIIQSTESSNRIEGVTVAPERSREWMAPGATPRDRSEALLLGYREVLARIHAHPGEFRITEDTIREFHRGLYQFTDLKGGEWKRSDNYIEEALPEGRVVTRFVPVSARDTPFHMKELCARFDRLWTDRQLSPLLLTPAFVLDFLCIHPFTDGNGRVGRLLMVLLLHQAGYEVGRYISLERIIEETKETYYESLKRSSEQWHEGRHRLVPWWEYCLGVLLKAYGEFERRVGTATKAGGGKSAIVEEAIRRLPPTFRIADVERACLTMNRDSIRRVLNDLRGQGKVMCRKRGRGALWEKCGG